MGAARIGPARSPWFPAAQRRFPQAVLACPRHGLLRPLPQESAPTKSRKTRRHPEKLPGQARSAAAFSTVSLGLLPAGLLRGHDLHPVSLQCDHRPKVTNRLLSAVGHSLGTGRTPNAENRLAERDCHLDLAQPAPPGHHHRRNTCDVRSVLGPWQSGRAGPKWCFYMRGLNLRPQGKWSPHWTNAASLRDLGRFDPCRCQPA
jgi:hypothetical protein